MRIKGCHSVVRGKAGRPALLASAVLGMVAAGGSALADVQSVTQMGGPPRLPIPTYQETGLPDFTMPVGRATFPDGSPAPEAAEPSGNGDPGGAGVGNVAQGWDGFAGQSVGSGQCVALVQAADPGVGLTRTWAQGAQVQGNTSLVPGTVIATFDGIGRYANATDGSSHAAIYLGQNAQGIQVLDQWADHPAATERSHGRIRAAKPRTQGVPSMSSPMLKCAAQAMVAVVLASGAANAAVQCPPSLHGHDLRLNDGGSLYLGNPADMMLQAPDETKRGTTGPINTWRFKSAQGMNLVCKYDGTQEAVTLPLPGASRVVARTLVV